MQTPKLFSSLGAFLVQPVLRGSSYLVGLVQLVAKSQHDIPTESFMFWAGLIESLDPILDCRLLEILSLVF